MNNWTGTVIACSWMTFFLVWLVNAFNVKRTARHYTNFWFRYILLMGVAIVGLGWPGRFSQNYLWHSSLGLGVVCDVIVLAGLAFAVWARLTLGRNWSGNVTLKQDHELITTGPYCLVRHPIYSGMMLMALGTAIDGGLILTLVIFFMIVIGLRIKYQQEERVMTEHFGKRYSGYKKRVRAIIPYIY